MFTVVTLVQLLILTTHANIKVYHKNTHSAFMSIENKYQLLTSEFPKTAIVIDTSSH